MGKICFFFAVQPTRSRRGGPRKSKMTVQGARNRHFSQRKRDKMAPIHELMQAEDSVRTTSPGSLEYHGTACPATSSGTREAPTAA